MARGDVSIGSTRGRRTVARLVAGALVTALLLVVVAALTALVVLPRVVGGAALTVLSGSMTPGIAVGSVVVVRPVDPADLRVGDVMTFQVRAGESTFITHRIAAITRDPTGLLVFTTKGDANAAADPDPVPAGAVRGRLWYTVPEVGTLARDVRTPRGALVLGVVVLCGYAVMQLAGAARDRGVPASPWQGRRTSSRQLLLATVATADLDPGRFESLVESLRASVVAATSTSVTLELVGAPAVVEDAVHLLAAVAPVVAQRSSVLEAPLGGSGSAPAVRNGSAPFGLNASAPFGRRRGRHASGGRLSP